MPKIYGKDKNGVWTSAGGGSGGGVQVDETLSKAGYAADAAVVGEALNKQSEAIADKRTSMEWYGTTSSGERESIKAVTTVSGDFRLEKGSQVSVKFLTNSEYCQALNVDGTGVVYIHETYVDGAEDLPTGTAPNLWHNLGQINTFIYDGKYFIVEDGVRATADNHLFGKVGVSDSVTLDSGDYVASSRAAKRAYDKAMEAYNIASSGGGSGGGVQVDEIYILGEEETVEDAPDTAKEIIDPYDDAKPVDLGQFATKEDLRELSGEIADLENKIPLEVGGMTKAQISALDGMFKIASYTTDPTTAYSAFKAAFGIEDGGEVEPDEPDTEVTLTSISATYSGGDVAVGTALTDLTGIVVTATYSDGSTATVTDYTLTGEIAEGSNTITVTYHGMTATFAVTGVAESTEVVKTLFTGTNLLDGKEYTLLNASPFGYQVPISLPIGTYYLYDVYKTSGGYVPKLLTYDGSAYNNVTSDVSTITKTGLFLTGLPHESFPDLEKSDYYKPNGAGYLVEFTIVISEDFEGYLNVGTTGQWYGLAETGWSLLSTEQFNPFKQTLS